MIRLVVIVRFIVGPDEVRHLLIVTVIAEECGHHPCSFPGIIPSSVVRFIIVISLIFLLAITEIVLVLVRISFRRLTATLRMRNIRPQYGSGVSDALQVEGACLGKFMSFSLKPMPEN